ncbi:unnamed protein product [Clonostachys solani]|uniref:Major facilitator superfamily (MFS) profile domain-containing protein n=1 Tax=Clonostachys solani TaxID=160281 RepID=A0A9N9VYB2_9HYPO|nr:unnamed protein product [Clonostachys solani]
MRDRTPQHLAMNITKEATESSSSPEDTTSTPPNSGNPVVAPDSIPNQGLRAWMQVVGSFCLYFNTWGLISSYGTFQTIYETGPLKGHSHFQISVIGSLQSFLMVFLGLVTGPIYDAGYFHHLLGIGSVLIVVGTVVQSFCTQLWHYMLAQGVVIGLGAGCLILLSVATTSMWFTTKLPLANGIAASGSGLGGVLLPIMVRQLHAQVGLAWAIRSVALICLVLLVVANACLRPRGPGAVRKKPRSLIDATAFKDWPYIFFVLGCVVTFLGMYTPFVYIQSYSLEGGVISSHLSLYMLAILNSSSIFGRILPIFLAQRLGPMNMIVLTGTALGITSLCLVTASSMARVLAAIVVYGFFTGTFFALQPTIVVRLTSDAGKIGTRFGMAFSVFAIALLFGPPIAGALRDEFSYNIAWIWAGVALLVGAATIAAGRVAKVGWQLQQRC